VTLDLVVRAFNRGATAEEIVQKFPSVELSEVYQAIGYYLKHKAELRKTDRRSVSLRQAVPRQAEPAPDRDDFLRRPVHVFERFLHEIRDGQHNTLRG
jgi:hypothetical protein